MNLICKKNKQILSFFISLTLVLGVCLNFTTNINALIDLEENTEAPIKLENHSEKTKGTVSGKVWADRAGRFSKYDSIGNVKDQPLEGVDMLMQWMADDGTMSKLYSFKTIKNGEFTIKVPDIEKDGKKIAFVPSKDSKQKIRIWPNIIWSIDNQLKFAGGSGNARFAGKGELHTSTIWNEENGKERIENFWIALQASETAFHDPFEEKILTLKTSETLVHKDEKNKLNSASSLVNNRVSGIIFKNNSSASLQKDEPVFNKNDILLANVPVYLTTLNKNKVIQKTYKTITNQNGAYEFILAKEDEKTISNEQKLDFFYISMDLPEPEDKNAYISYFSRLRNVDAYELANVKNADSYHYIGKEPVVESGKNSIANLNFTVYESNYLKEIADPKISLEPEVLEIFAGDIGIKGTGVPKSEILVKLNDESKVYKTLVKDDKTFSITLDKAAKLNDKFKISQKTNDLLISKELVLTAMEKITILIDKNGGKALFDKMFVGKGSTLKPFPIEAPKGKELDKFIIVGSDEEFIFEKTIVTKNITLKAIWRDKSGDLPENPEDEFPDLPDLPDDKKPVNPDDNKPVDPDDKDPFNPGDDNIDIPEDLDNLDNLDNLDDLDNIDIGDLDEEFSEENKDKKDKKDKDKNDKTDKKDKKDKKDNSKEIDEFGKIDELDDKEAMSITLNYDTMYSYIAGYPDGSIKPLRKVSREEAAVMIYRVLDREYLKSVSSKTRAFTDVALTRWSNIYIGTLSKANVINGYPNSKFKPADNITRAELMAIVTKLAPFAKGDSHPYTDLSGHWSEKYVKIASSMGWIKESKSKMFRPETQVSRAEFVSVLNRVIGRTGGNISELKGKKSFKDLSEKDWYYEDFIMATIGDIPSTIQSSSISEPSITQIDGLDGSETYENPKPIIRKKIKRKDYSYDYMRD